MTICSAPPPPSTHQAPVVRLNIEPHPNADNLGIVTVFGMSKVVVNKHDWKDGDLAAYIQPDSLVDTSRPEFSFLAKKQPCPDASHVFERIRTRKFRGVWSQGLLVPAPAGTKEGDNVADLLGVTHYNPEEVFHNQARSAPSQARSAPSEPVPSPLSQLSKYDVESLRKFYDAIPDGEEVVATEKIHGSNSRFVHHGGRFYCGSRTRWTFPADNDPWWSALTADKLLQQWLEAHPGFVVFAELYGNVTNLKYGCQKNERRLAVFDLFDTQRWCFLSHDAARLAAPELPWVPVLYRGPYSFTKLEEVAHGATVLGNGAHTREGCVVKPVFERNDAQGNRLCYKLVSNEYLAL